MDGGIVKNQDEQASIWRMVRCFSTALALRVVIDSHSHMNFVPPEKALLNLISHEFEDPFQI